MLVSAAKPAAAGVMHLPVIYAKHTTLVNRPSARQHSNVAGKSCCRHIEQRRKPQYKALHTQCKRPPMRTAVSHSSPGSKRRGIAASQCMSSQTASMPGQAGVQVVDGMQRSHGSKSHLSFNYLDFKTSEGGGASAVHCPTRGPRSVDATSSS